MNTLEKACKQALEFCEFLWREVPLNDYAEHKREQLESSLRLVLEKNASWNDPSTVPNAGEFLIGVWSGDWNDPCQRFTVFHAHGTSTGPSWSMKSNYRTEEGGAYKIAGWMDLPDKI